MANNKANREYYKLLEGQIYTYPSDDVTVTGTDGSATAVISPNNTIVVEATTMNDAATITLATPIGFKVTGMKVINTLGGDKVQGAMSCQLKNTTTAITDAVDQGGVADMYSVEAAYIDDAQDTFAVDDDDLVLTFAGDDASSTSTNSCRVIIYIQPN